MGKTKSEIRDAHTRFLAKDWAHRNFSLADQVLGVQRILQGKGNSPGDKEVHEVIRNRLYARLVRYSLLIYLLGHLLQNLSPLPAAVRMMGFSVLSFAFLLLLSTTIGAHFHPYRSPGRDSSSA
ncbi:MAG: hypothetical protein AAGJ79_06550 [Verrucomicrobiota bacterium]